MTAHAYAEPQHPRKRPPRAFVIADPPADEVGAEVDWSRWYLTDEDDMSEGCEQGEIIDQARSSLRNLAAERAFPPCYVAGDTFFAWVEAQPLVRISPDLYLLDDPPPPPMPSIWQTWQPGHHAPRFAVEIVSTDWQKDYDDNPPKYAQLGVSELVLFDPGVVTSAVKRPARRVALQMYRRDDDGAFVRVYGGDGPVYSEELGVWLVARREGVVARLRLSYDEAGLEIVRTEKEAADVRAQTAAARALDAETRALDAETREQAEARRREAAERELGEARAELARLKRAAT